MKVEDLKRGDKIKVAFGNGVSNAKVLNNFKKAKLIHLRIGWYGKSLDAYDSYRFDLLD